MPRYGETIRKYRLLLAVVSLAGICFLLYHNTFGNGFVYDDTRQVIGNHWLRDYRYLPTIFTSGVWSFRQFGVDWGVYYRPVMHLIFSLEYHAFKLHPAPYHIVNVTLHALNTVLVFLFLRSLVRALSRGDDSDRASSSTDKLALVAALIFAFSPINSEVINWISALPELTYTPSFLLAVWCYFKARGGYGRYHSASLAFYTLSLLCKETAIMLPAMLLAFDLITYDKDDERGWFRKITLWVTRNPLFLAITVAFLVWRKHVLGVAVLSLGFNLTYVIPVFSWAVELFFRYIGETLYPFHLAVDHVYHAHDLLLFYSAFTAFLTYLVFRYALFRQAIRLDIGVRSRNILLVGLTLFALPLVPVLNFVVLPTCVLDERYLYLPMVGFSLLLALLLLNVFDRLRSRPLGKAMFFLVIVVAISAFSVTIFRRNTEWRDDISLFSAALAVEKDSYLAEQNLSQGYCDQGNVEACKRHLKSYCALSADPGKNAYTKCIERSEYHYELGTAYARAGNPEAAIRHYRRALHSSASRSLVYNDMGAAYLAEGDYAKAEQSLRLAAALSPTSYDIYENLGLVSCARGDLSEARRFFDQATTLGYFPDLAPLQSRSDCPIRN